MVVTETASVTADDWPYERAPLAADSEAGWRDVVSACRPHGTLVLAGLGHRGLQGSSAHSRSVLWGPSPVADVVTRELPAQMGPSEIEAVVAGFAAATARAVAADTDGVELDAGPTALLRQFLSPLTNRRDDDYGTDRTRLLREVVAAVRAVLGPGRILGLRLSCDELAPWGGMGPDDAANHARALADSLDLLTVVRGGPTTVSRYRPDAHTRPMFNVELAQRIRSAVAGAVPIVLQGSVTDPAAARRALDGGAADLVEMTRAQISDPDLVATVRAGRGPRPCTLCNQTCLVCDPRNPTVTCIGNPDTHADPPHLRSPRDVLVVGGGPAGLEAARVLARAGHAVRLVERTRQVGGMLAATAHGPGRDRLSTLTDWLADECRGLGVRIELDHEATAEDTAAADAVIAATGSVPAPWSPMGDGTVPVLRAPTVLTSNPPISAGPAPMLVWDPIGGPVGVAAAEHLAASGASVAVVTPDPVVGTELARTGDLAEANGRLQRAGVTRHLRSRIVGIAGGAVELEQLHTGERTVVAASALVDCGHRVPDESVTVGTAVGDRVAPRTAAEAIREGRQAALRLIRQWS